MNAVLPKSIKIGGFDYAIEISDYHNQELEAKTAWGDHSEFLKRIRVASGCSSQQFSQAALHEILHAVDFVYNNGNLSEDAVSALSNGLHQILEQLGIRFTHGEVE